MNCTKEPYQCPGHECCDYNPPYETRIIYESDNESMVSHRLIIEGETDLPGDHVYTKGFEDTISSEHVSISCCHNQEAFFWESGIVRRNALRISYSHKKQDNTNKRTHKQNHLLVSLYSMPSL